MLINFQGFDHFLNHVNNQDFFYETSRMLLVLDGCSSAKYSEVGTRLFTQLFSRKEENDSVEKFESNVKEVFEDIIEMMRKYYPDPETLERDFIMENMLFTIIACFNCEDKFIVKMFGDGYIITQNKMNHLSYMKFSYGKYPPYFAYKYCTTLDIFKDHGVKTFEFDKKMFKSVGIASDGILPIVKGSAQIDHYIVKKDKIGLEMAIKLQNQAFADDVTIAIFEDTEPNTSASTGKNAIEESFNIDMEIKELIKTSQKDESMKKLEVTLFGEKPVKKPSTPVQLVSMSNGKPENKSAEPVQNGEVKNTTPNKNN